MAFVMFLCCLTLLGVIPVSALPQVGGLIFVQYLDLVRELQKVYMLEPAGSHGNEEWLVNARWKILVNV